MAVVFQVRVPIRDYLRRDPVAALAHARSCIELCDEVGMPDRKAETQIFEGWALAELGEAERGIELINRGREFWEFAGAKIADPVFLSVLATALLKAGRLDDARAAVGDGLAQIGRTGERMWQAELHRLDGEISLAMNGNGTAQAQASFVKAIDVAQELKARLFELRATASLARLWQGQGRPKEALELLAPIYNWFTEGFDTPDLKEAKALLTELRCEIASNYDPTPEVA